MATDTLIIAGKKYFSSKTASEMSGLARDYVGQLCREGRLDARLVGRNWYVSEDSITNHERYSRVGGKDVRTDVKKTQKDTLTTQIDSAEATDREDFELGKNLVSDSLPVVTEEAPVEVGANRYLTETPVVHTMLEATSPLRESTTSSEPNTVVAITHNVARGGVSEHGQEDEHAADEGVTQQASGQPRLLHTTPASKYVVDLKEREYRATGYDKASTLRSRDPQPEVLVPWEAAPRKLRTGRVGLLPRVGFTAVAILSVLLFGVVLGLGGYRDTYNGESHGEVYIGGVGNIPEFSVARW